MSWTMPIGARCERKGTHFRVWAPRAQQVAVVRFDGAARVEYALIPEAGGYFAGYLAGVGVGDRYMYQLDGGDLRPDPASRWQPDGPHGPSAVVAPADFRWGDGGWSGRTLEELTIYELHVGTFTPEGTFDAAIMRLDALRELGVSAIELLPVADFPGERNWGYDGVNLFAPARAYGGPEGLRRLVDAAHAHGLAVILDVVYNHLGPDGNYLREFSLSYFTDRHHTPWGDALNFDGPESGPVRAFFIANALHWAHEYHLDGLRLDATHAILDDSPTHILAELAARVHASLPAGRQFMFIAENEHNDPMLARPGAVGPGDPRAGDRETREINAADSSKPPSFPVSQPKQGWGFDAIWADDFHHQLRVALAGDHESYYADYSGSAQDLATTMRQGWFYIGQDSAFLGQPRGAPADDLPPQRFVYCIQNHDQVGNRALGERLSHDIGLDAYRAASALLLLCPQTPLLWMGQEWAASTPFLFFTDHNVELGRLVTEGRRSEFARFTAFSGEKVPDPQAEETFARSKLRWDERDAEPHAAVLRLYRDLLRLRREQPALRKRSRTSFAVAVLDERAIALRREGPTPADTLLAIINLHGERRLSLGEQPETRSPAGRWALLLDSDDPAYGGRGENRLAEDGARLTLSGAGAVVLRVA